MAHIFISYSKKDILFARHLRSLLQDQGFEVWMDETKLVPSERWWPTIERNIVSCSVFVVIMSSNSRESDWVEREILIAESARHKKPIFPILLEGEVWSRLANIQYSDMTAALESELPASFIIGLQQIIPVGSERMPSLQAADLIRSQFDEVIQTALAQLSQAELQAIPLTTEIASQLAKYSPRTMQEYQLVRIATWSQSAYHFPTHMVPLTLLVEQGEDASQHFTSGQEFHSLSELLTKAHSPSLVLLGAPGLGKSTLLQHLELDTAVAGLKDETTPVTFYISLAEYQPEKSEDPFPSPINWLSRRWEQLYPELPSLQVFLDNRQVLLLLDGLNELPHSNLENYRERVEAWQLFIQEYVHGLSGNRAVFTCRSLDYSIALSTKEMRVAQARVQKMSEKQVQDYLQTTLLEASNVDIVWQWLKAERHRLELFRTPYFVKLLTDQLNTSHHFPEGLAQLFSGFVRQLLKREMYHSLLKPGDFLTEADCTDLNNIATIETDFPTFLPDEGLLIPTLTLFAYRLQDTPRNTDQIQVRILRKQAPGLLSLPPELRREFFNAAFALNLLDSEGPFIHFFHQLLQEFFAARYLAEVPDPHKWRVEWQTDKIAPIAGQDNIDRRDNYHNHEPLPPLPRTGWEETTVIAAGLASNPEQFVRQIMAENLTLAAQCATQPEVHIDEQLKEELRQALIARTQDQSADLRVRIEAGFVLGNLHDPRFLFEDGSAAPYLLPPLVTIPADTYWIGSDHSPSHDEMPKHTVTLAEFKIGKFPVTNGEYELFIAAGGYDDERWWRSTSGKGWRHGETIANGRKQQWRMYRNDFKQLIADDLLEVRVREGRLTPQEAANYAKMAEMSQDEFEDLIAAWYPAQSLTRPQHWNDDLFSNPAQPVVGICWYEANAYCAWLTTQTQLPFRLPTEFEWEAAARGVNGRQYAYGDNFDAASCNTVESRVHCPAPIGVFTSGQTPEGVADITGNVWEWTSSHYRPYPSTGGQTDKRYEQAQDYKVARGGCWAYFQFYARAAARFANVPEMRSNLIGFRMACDV